MLIKLLEELEQHIQESKHHGMKYIIQAFERAAAFGKMKWIQCGDLCGRIRDIDASGALILENQAGSTKKSSQERSNAFDMGNLPNLSI